MRGFYKDKKVLVAGGTGLIGRPLVRMLKEAGAKVLTVAMDGKFKLDLRVPANCHLACEDQEVVFNLVGVKGSPSATLRYPARFFTPTLQTSINMMEAARQCKVKHYLYTSTVGVYEPAPVFHEDAMWQGSPSENDRFAGWAKRMGELQAEAYDIEFGFKTSIVRPANVYGPWDNFDSSSAMVLPSLIAKVVHQDGPLLVWGDGSAIRDFVHADDVARGMMLVVERQYYQPVNLASGRTTTIKEVAELIAKHAPGGPREVIFQPDKLTGDKIRLMDITRANSLGYSAQVDLEAGIAETIHWYTHNREHTNTRYIAFRDEIFSK
jgi:GDP-L-fucose synthase